MANIWLGIGDGRRGLMGFSDLCSHPRQKPSRQVTRGAVLKAGRADLALLIGRERRLLHRFQLRDQ